jgi:hypothetical protein
VRPDASWSSNPARWCRSSRCDGPATSPIVYNRLWRRFARFKLSAHFLDLRSPFVETHSDLRNRCAEVFLQLRDRRLLFLHFALLLPDFVLLLLDFPMLFNELVGQGGLPLDLFWPVRLKTASRGRSSFPPKKVGVAAKSLSRQGSLRVRATTTRK